MRGTFVRELVEGSACLAILLLHRYFTNIYYSEAMEQRTASSQLVQLLGQYVLSADHRTQVDH